MAQEYIATQAARAKRGEISAGRIDKLKSEIGTALNSYVGTTQVHLIGQESWDN